MLRDLYVAAGSLPRTGAEELAAGSDLAAGRKDGAVIDLMRGAKAEAKARAMIERGGDGVAAGLGEAGERGALGEVLADEAVGVLVGAAFPGMMRGGEVDFGAESAFEVLVAVELDAVVGREGMDGMGLMGEQRGQARVGLLDGGPDERAEDGVAALALDSGGNAGLAPAVDGVRFPVAESTALRDDFRPILDAAFAREPAAAILSAVAFAPALAGAAEVPPERAAGTLVAPNPEVDRLMAHDRKTEKTPASHDLLRTPILFEERRDHREVLGPVTRIAPRVAATATGHLLGLGRPVGAVIRGGVAPHLSRNRAVMPSQRRCDLAAAQALLTQGRDSISFLRAQLPIIHRPQVSHLPPESKEPNKALQATTTSVTISAYAELAPAAVAADL